MVIRTSRTVVRHYDNSGLIGFGLHEVRNAPSTKTSYIRLK